MNPSPVSYSFNFLEVRFGGGGNFPLLPPGGENSSFSDFLGDYYDGFLLGAVTYFLGACAFGFFFFLRKQQQQHAKLQQQHIGAIPKPNITNTNNTSDAKIIRDDGNPKNTVAPAKATAIKKR